MKRLLFLLLVTSAFSITGCALFEQPEEFDPNALPTTAAGEVISLTTQILSGNDDAEEKSSGNMSLGSSDLELTTDRGNQQTVGLRFKLDIPPNAVINDATVRFTVDEVSTGPSDLTIYVEDTDNSAPFTTAKRNISSRVKSSSSVNWIAWDWKNAGVSSTAQTTPPISDLIQDLVNRPGWLAGNYISIIIEGTGTRTAVSYNGNSAEAAILNVTYAPETLVVEPTPEPLPPEPEAPPSVVFKYQGIAFDPLVKPVYDIAYRDGFMSIDSDGDGLPDSWEMAYGLDPNKATDATDRNIDPDQDLLTAREEFLAGTNPSDADSDGDGMPDGYEVSYSLNPLDSADALFDLDGDGYTNLDEYLKGTDPSDPLFFPVVTPTTYTVEAIWDAPTSRLDGSYLAPEEIASFTIYYGATETSLDSSVLVSDPTLRSYQIEFSSPGEYFFSITATDTNGVESEPSPVGQIVIAQ